MNTPNTQNGVGSDALLADFLSKLIEHMDDCGSWRLKSIVASDCVKGGRQDNPTFGHVYIEQYSGYFDDDYYGNTYIPLPDGKYLKVGYSC